MDVLALRIVVGAIGLMGCLSLVGIVVLASEGHQPPDILVQFVLGTPAALIALLYPNGKAGGGPPAER